MTRPDFQWADAHVHLDLYGAEERVPLLEEAFRSGASAVVGVSMHLASCIVNRELARMYPGRIMPAYGFHPEQAVPQPAEVDALLRWIRDRHDAGEAFAIGEVGLPYYLRTKALKAGRSFDEAPYLQLLARFCALAAELDRPIVLHAVHEDAGKACELLEKYGVRRAHFHWFKGTAETVQLMIARGYRISVTPDVAYEPETRQLVTVYPLELMMAETDGPWPFQGPYEGKATRLSMTADAIVHIAAIKGLKPGDAAETILAGTKAFYNIS
jgi:TatD DNase family protein